MFIAPSLRHHSGVFFCLFRVCHSPAGCIIVTLKLSSPHNHRRQRLAQWQPLASRCFSQYYSLSRLVNALHRQKKNTAVTLEDRRLSKWYFQGAAVFSGCVLWGSVRSDSAAQPISVPPSPTQRMLSEFFCVFCGRRHGAKDYQDVFDAYALRFIKCSLR